MSGNKDDAPKGDANNKGLLSRVVSFVRNPATGWADLDSDAASRDSEYSKQMLKDMIERKRRNDFVRKREFDMLRKLRRSEAMAGHDPTARPSFFQSSLPSKPDDRASTLKKIDEIEAQMSMQWWKSKRGGDSSISPRTTGFQVSSTSTPGNAPAQPSVPPVPAMPAAPAHPDAYTRTEPAPLMPAQAFGQLSAGPSGAQPVPPLPPLEFDVPAPVAPAPVVIPASLPQVAQVSDTVSPSSLFTQSKFHAIDVGEYAHDPDLEDASIRFANGDDAGAEASLRALLGPGGSRAAHEDIWLALMDLYQASGQQARFEETAVEFAARFARSAPQWRALSDPARTAATAAPAATGGGPVADWTCPSVVGTQTVAAMLAALARAPQPWRLSWAKLATIEDAALEPLARVFAQWARQPVRLRFIAPGALERLLLARTVAGDRTVSAAWWLLRLEVLRVLRRPDEFELVSLDYCVTYEVSPPSWERPACEYKPLAPDGGYVPGHTVMGDGFGESAPSGLSGLGSGFGDTNLSGSSHPPASVSRAELRGAIQGNATDALAELDQRLLGADMLVVSCAQLARIDFSAAGALLNWTTARQAEGRQVQFTDVNRLVAAFFNVVGIGEYARVVVRRD